MNSSAQLGARENVHRKSAIPGADIPSSVEVDIATEQVDLQVHVRESSKKCLLQRVGELDKPCLEQYAGRQIGERVRFERRMEGGVVSIE